MARQMVRCIGGHVFDYAQRKTCPVCGVQVYVAGSAEASTDASPRDVDQAISPAEAAAENPDAALPPPQNQPATSAKNWRPLVTAFVCFVAGAIVVVGAIKFILPGPQPLAKTVSSPASQGVSKRVPRPSASSSAGPGPGSSSSASNTVASPRQAPAVAGTTSSSSAAPPPPAALAMRAQHLAPLQRASQNTAASAIHAITHAPAAHLFRQLIFKPHLSVREILDDIHIFDQILPQAGRLGPRTLALIPYCAGGQLFNVTRPRAIVAVEKLAFAQGVAAAAGRIAMAYAPGVNSLPASDGGTAAAARWYYRGAMAGSPNCAYWFLIEVSEHPSADNFLLHPLPILHKLALFAYTNSDSTFLNVFNMAPDSNDPAIADLQKWAALPKAPHRPLTLIDYYNQNLRSHPRRLLAVLKKYDKIGFPRASDALGLAYSEGALMAIDTKKSAHYYVKSAASAGYRSAFAQAPLQILRVHYCNHYKAAILALLARTKFPQVPYSDMKPVFLQHKAMKHLTPLQLRNVKALQKFLLNLCNFLQH